MKILFLTQWFQPEPFFKGLPFAKALYKRGHEVEVLTGYPNYPGGKVYPGYKLRFHQKEKIDGIFIHRVPLYPSHDKSGFRRTLNYLSFGLFAAMLGPLLVRKPDVIYVYNLVTLGLASFVLKAIHGCAVVYDVQDLWPDSVADSGAFQNRSLLAVLNKLCLQTYKFASHVVTLSPGMKTELIRRGVDENKVSFIYNWYEEEHMQTPEYQEHLASRLGIIRKFVIMYAGTMGVMQGLDVVLTAAQMLEITHTDVVFVLVGAGVEQEKLKRLASESELSNVLFLNRQPSEKMGALFSLADVMLVHLKASPLFEITIPSKIQAYMAAGKPILLGIRGDAAKIITASDSGIVFEPEEPESIVQGVLDFYNMSLSRRKIMGKNARAYYEREMKMNTAVHKFEKLFQSFSNQ